MYEMSFTINLSDMNAVILDGDKVYIYLTGSAFTILGRDKQDAITIYNYIKSTPVAPDTNVFLTIKDICVLPDGKSE